MSALLDTHAPEIVASIRLLLEYEDTISPTMLSRALEELDISMSPREVGWWLKKSGAFKKKRRHQGTRWAPIRPRLRKIYEEFGL